MSATGPRYTHAAALEVHETDDGLVVFNPATDRVHHLNYTAGGCSSCAMTPGTLPNWPA